MVTQITFYIEYLLSTPHNYMCTYLAEHLARVSHDQVNRLLRQSYPPSDQLRELVQPLSADSPGTFLLRDDSVRGKSHSRFIEVANYQSSGNEHSLVTDICLVNLVHSSGQAGDFLPLYYRVYAPGLGGVSKNEHFQATFAQVLAEGKIPACTLLFGAWYGSSDNVKLIHHAGWRFFTTLKRNMLMSASKQVGFQALLDVAPPPGCWSTGLQMRLHKVPYAVRSSKLIASNGAMEWVMTNNFVFTLTQQALEATKHVRWQVEEFQRSSKLHQHREVPVSPAAGPTQPIRLAAIWRGYCCAKLRLKQRKLFIRITNSSGLPVCANSWLNGSFPHCYSQRRKS